MSEVELRWFDFFDRNDEVFVRQVAGIWRRCLPEVGGNSSFLMDYDAVVAAGPPINHGEHDVAIVLDGKPIAAGVLHHDLRANLADCTANVVVEKNYRRRGFGTQILDALTTKAQELGMQRMGAWPVTAAGREPLGELFCAAQGFLEIDPYRESSLELPISGDLLCTLETKAAAGLGSEYLVEAYLGLPPVDTHEGLALMRRRMTTDAPHNLNAEEGRTTPADIVESYAADERAGRTRITALARTGSGEAVAFSELSFGNDATRADQGETLALAEHRGRRLGLAVKLATLRLLQQTHPEILGIDTGNHRDNAPMLAVNDMFGFIETARSAHWLKEL